MRAFSLAVGLAFAVAGLTGCIEAHPVSLEPATVIASVPTDQAGENSGAGAVIGAVVLGGAGGAVGEGAGKALAVAGGVIVGATAGSVAEAAHQSHDGIAYTIRLTATGQVLTLIEHLDPDAPVFRPGAAVVLETDGRRQVLLAAGQAPTPSSPVP